MGREIPFPSILRLGEPLLRPAGFDTLASFSLPPALQRQFSQMATNSASGAMLLVPAGMGVGAQALVSWDVANRSESWPGFRLRLETARGAVLVWQPGARSNGWQELATTDGQTGSARWLAQGLKPGAGWVDLTPALDKARPDPGRELWLLLVDEGGAAQPLARISESQNRLLTTFSWEAIESARGCANPGWEASFFTPAFRIAWPDGRERLRARCLWNAANPWRSRGQVPTETGRHLDFQMAYGAYRAVLAGTEWSAIAVDEPVPVELEVAGAPDAEVVLYGVAGQSPAVESTLQISARPLPAGTLRFDLRKPLVDLHAAQAALGRGRFLILVAIRDGNREIIVAAVDVGGGLGGGKGIALPI